MEMLKKNCLCCTIMLRRLNLIVLRFPFFVSIFDCVHSACPMLTLTFYSSDPHYFFPREPHCLSKVKGRVTFTTIYQVSHTDEHFYI